MPMLEFRRMSVFAPSAPAEAATNKKMLAVDDSGGTETDGDNVQ